MCVTSLSCTEAHACSIHVMCRRTLCSSHVIYRSTCVQQPCHVHKHTCATAMSCEEEHISWFSSPPSCSHIILLLLEGPEPRCRGRDLVDMYHLWLSTHCCLFSALRTAVCLCQPSLMPMSSFSVVLSPNGQAKLPYEHLH